MNQEERKTAIRRMRVLLAALHPDAAVRLRLIFCSGTTGTILNSQATNTTDYKFTVTAARGDIVDSRGAHCHQRQLVHNGAQQAADG